MESEREVARRGRNTLNEGAGDHVKQMQERWPASLKQKHCPCAVFCFFVFCVVMAAMAAEHPIITQSRAVDVT